MMQSCDIRRVHDIYSGIKLLDRELIKLQKIPDKENSEAIDLLLPEDFDNILQVVEDITCYKDITGYRLYVFSLISYRLKNLCMRAPGESRKYGFSY